MLQYNLQQLGAARERLAVSDVGESDADTKLVAMAKNLQSYRRMSCVGWCYNDGMIMINIGTMVINKA